MTSAATIAARSGETRSAAKGLDPAQPGKSVTAPTGPGRPPSPAASNPHVHPLFAAMLDTMKGPRHGK